MENTAKNFAIQLGSLISLYISVGSLITLLFGIITIVYPDVAQIDWEREAARSGIRFSIAMLVVFFPTYVVLTRFVNVVRRHEEGTYLTLTKWLIYLSLLIGGGVLLGDIVAVISNFLNGEITIRFILKALTVLLVTGTAFTYYLFDVRGYWQTRQQYSVYYVVIITLAVITSLITGFLHIETPQEVRDRTIDTKQITDLQNIQSMVANYVALNNILPYTIEDASNGLEIPQAPEGREPYTYGMKGTENFELCAEFITDSSYGNTYYGATYSEPLTIKNPDNWEHGTGHWCFARKVNTIGK